jgi:hypothetical protein
MRVVEVAQLAGCLEKLLKQAPGSDLLVDEQDKELKVVAMDPNPNVKFTSAELGVQMTESPGKVFIVIDIPIRDQKQLS